VAFTEQFGFYINDRYSSPVVQKRFNPYLFFSFNPNHCSKKAFWRNLYTEFGYGHESNGQAIEDPATFASQVKNTQNKGTTFATAVQEASDYNSRGWDYWRLRAYENIPLDGAGRHCLVADASFRWYLAYGFLEGKQENYRNWETAYGYTGAGLTRDQVSGLSCAVSYLHRTPDDSSFHGAFNYTKLSLMYETGYKGVFEHNTLKVYAGFKMFFLPLALTYSYGYNTSLANYGVPVSSWGISLVLNSFSFPWLRQGSSAVLRGSQNPDK
jgi:hypothetical protein